MDLQVNINLQNMQGKKKMVKRVTAIDLFSGAGGLHLGFSNQGFDILLSSDVDESCEATHLRNFPEVPFLRKDISKITKEDIVKYTKSKKIDIVIGGPPCQGFSTIGKRASSDPKKRKQKDPRNYLFEEYIRLIKIIKPKYVLMENVKGLVTMKYGDGLFIDKIIDEFKKAGYKNVDYKILDVADYGVPQHRKRVIILGNRIGKKVTFPEPTHCSSAKNGKKKHETVGNAIMDLIGKENKIPNHIPMNHGWKNVERYKLIPEGGRMPEKKLSKKIYRKNFGNTFKRLDRKKPSLTMVPGHSAFPVHPTENRSLTVREAARIQTFPDDMEFIGSRTRQGMQVGNAVPVKFAEKIANHIRTQL